MAYLISENKKFSKSIPTEESGFIFECWFRPDAKKEKIIEKYVKNSDKKKLVMEMLKLL